MANRGMLALAAIGLAALALAGCNAADIPKDIRPIPAALVARMDAQGMKETSPVLIRIFKEESALEVWKQKSDGQYGLLKTYKICKWSGQLGPKVREGDRQAPEGFYTVVPAQMNPASHYYLSFNIGFPNAYDQAMGRTGSNLMVHGACSSSGCYSMTDADSGELFALARDAFRGGQTEFQIEAFPFRMTPENLARHKDDPNMPFWRMLKVGYDHFEVTRQVPKVNVCNKAYVFDADAGDATFRAALPCPRYTIPEPIASAVSAKQAIDDQKFKEAVIRLADKAQQDADKAAKEAYAREHPKPGLLNLWSHRETQPADAATAPAGTLPPVPRPSPLAGISANPATPATAPAEVAAATPLPRLKPSLDASPVIKVSTVSKPAKLPKVVPAAAVPAAADVAVVAAPLGPPAAAPPAPPPPTTVASTQPTVGKIVNRRFDWPEEDFGDPAHADAQ